MQQSVYRNKRTLHQLSLQVRNEAPMQKITPTHKLINNNFSFYKEKFCSLINKKKKDTISPYPTVVMETIAHQNDSGMLSKSFFVEKF